MYKLKFMRKEASRQDLIKSIFTHKEKVSRHSELCWIEGNTLKEFRKALAEENLSLSGLVLRRIKEALWGRFDPSCGHSRKYVANWLILDLARISLINEEKHLSLCTCIN